MTEQLENALNELEEAGALLVPETAEIEAAGPDTQWSGDCELDAQWVLTKHADDSYTTHVGNEE